MTTSKAWTVSKGTLGSRPASASCRACRLTQDTHLMETLKLRSLPSPGMVTSSSTCVVDGREKIRIRFLDFKSKGCFIIAAYLENNNLISADGQGHGSVEILPPVIHRLSITKDLCFKVLDHVLHNFTKNTMQEKQITTMCRIFKLLINCVPGAASSAYTWTYRLTLLGHFSGLMSMS